MSMDLGQSRERHEQTRESILRGQRVVRFLIGLVVFMVLSVGLVVWERSW